MNKTKLVIAGNNAEYCRWLQSRPDLDPRRCRYVAQDRDLRGYSAWNAEIVLVGQYWLNAVVDRPGYLRFRFPGVTL